MLRFVKVFALASLLAPVTWSAPAAADDVEAATTPAPRGDQWWQDRNQQKNDLAQQETWQLVFLGDSITQGWEGEAKDIWQQHYANRAAGNLGFSGDETEHLAWRIANGNLQGQTPKLAVIMIGTNNLGNVKHSPKAVIAGISKVLDTLKQVTPDTMVLLLGIFPRGAAADDPYRAQIKEVNAALSKMADWERVHFLDIGHVFLEADGTLSKEVMPDALHLSLEGYRRWAGAIESHVLRLLDEKQSARVSLFDGESLTGWTNEEHDAAPKGWDVVDGALAVTGWGDDAYTEQQFDNFDLTCEWKLAPRSNSGIFYRVADYQYIVLGPEYQLIDDQGNRLRADADSALASNMDLFGACADKPCRAAGEWNESRIVARGQEVEHWLNGQRVLVYRFDTPEWKEHLADSQYARLTPFGTLTTGSFKLQNKLGKKVWYREIEVVKL